MLKLVGYVLLALGIGHTVVGFVLHRPAVAATLREGYVGSVLPHLPRQLAFWFLMFSALLLFMGQVTLHAADTNDLHLLKLLGWYLLAVGLLGAAALPKSPFWIAIAAAAVLLRAAYAQ